jgi:hypothetical protein
MTTQDERAVVADLCSRLALLRAELVRLAGACQAAVAADAAGEADPLAVVRAELARPPARKPRQGRCTGSRGSARSPWPLFSQAGGGGGDQPPGFVAPG